jgi:hypothetical protein
MRIEVGIVVKIMLVIAVVLYLYAASKWGRGKLWVTALASAFFAGAVLVGRSL